MPDRYIDQYETLAYGPFAVGQIEALVLPIDPDYTKALQHVTMRLHECTEAMAAVLKAAGEVEVVTYKQAPGDPITAAREVLRRAAKYIESRPDGDRLAGALLGGSTLTTVLRRRPAKLVAALGQAISVFDQHAKDLPESKSWVTALTAARDTLSALDKSVRASRIERRAMTPEVTRARSEWLRVYGAAKLIVEGVLRLLD